MFSLRHLHKCCKAVQPALPNAVHPLKTSSPKMEDRARLHASRSTLSLPAYSFTKWSRMAEACWGVGGIQGVDDGGVEVGWVMESQGWQDGNWRDEE